jgi:uncharacterized protein (TIGR00730 family)
MKKICVFCGSRFGNRPHYREAARALGAALAAADLGLVYGGGQVGLMGEVANAVLNAGGYVTGVIPEFLNSREVLHPGLQSCHTVTDLFERKAMMLDMADAFIALPGGIGTFDELLEVMAWRQLRQLDKPIGLLDVEGFFGPWLSALRHSAAEGFLANEELDRLLIAASPITLIADLTQGWRP